MNLFLTTAIILQAAISCLMTCKRGTYNLLPWKNHSGLLAIKTGACSKRNRQKGKEQKYERSVTYRNVMGRKKACLVIAHYNYTLRLRSCGLFRGTHGFALRTHKALPLTRSGRCPETSARAVSPMQPDQRVTLSLDSPLNGICP